MPPEYFRRNLVILKTTRNLIILNYRQLSRLLKSRSDFGYTWQDRKIIIQHIVTFGCSSSFLLIDFRKGDFEEKKSNTFDNLICFFSRPISSLILSEKCIASVIGIPKFWIVVERVKTFHPKTINPRTGCAWASRSFDHNSVSTTKLTVRVSLYLHIYLIKLSYPIELHVLCIEFCPRKCFQRYFLS